MATVTKKIVLETDTRAVLLIQVRYGYLLNRSVNARSDRSVENNVGVRLKLRLGGWKAVIAMKYGGNRAMTSTAASKSTPKVRRPRCCTRCALMPAPHGG